MASSTVFNEQLLEGLRPNFFELVANEAMQEALRPAFQYICKVCTNVLCKAPSVTENDLGVV